MCLLSNNFFLKLQLKKSSVDFPKIALLNCYNQKHIWIMYMLCSVCVCVCVWLNPCCHDSGLQWMPFLS